MTTSLYALMGFVFWTFFLLVCIGFYRVGSVLAGKAGTTDFPADVPHGPPMYRRLQRAHLNCLEGLPLFAAIVLVAAVAGYESGRFDMLARTVAFARVGQSLAHISSGRAVAVNVRFAFFALQLLCMIRMAYLLVM